MKFQTKNWHFDILCAAIVIQFVCLVHQMCNRVAWKSEKQKISIYHSFDELMIQIERFPKKKKNSMGN